MDDFSTWGGGTRRPSTDGHLTSEDMDMFTIPEPPIAEDDTRRMKLERRQNKHYSLWYLCAVMVTELRERNEGCAPSAFLHYSNTGMERSIRRLSRALNGDDWFLSHLDAALQVKA